MKPWRPQLLTLIIVLGLIGILLVVAELFGAKLSKEGWAAVGGVVTALAMIGSRLIEKD